MLPQYYVKARTYSNISPYPSWRRDFDYWQKDLTTNLYYLPGNVGIGYSIVNGGFVVSSNVGIGTNTPLGKLDVVGNIVSDSGSASNPSFSFRNNPSTGMYQSTNNVLAFSTNGNQRMIIDASGNLILNNNLVVNGSTVSINTNTVTVNDPVITLANNTTTDIYDRGIDFKWYDGSQIKTGFMGLKQSTSNFVLLSDASNNNNVYTGSTGGLQVRNLVCDVSTGIAPLTVTSSTLVSNLNSDYLDGLTSGQFMRSDVSTNCAGFIGIGTTSAVNVLHVENNSAASATQITCKNTNASGRAGIELSSGGTSSFNIQSANGTGVVENIAGTINFYAKGAGSYTFHTTGLNTARLIIANNGNVGIGSSIPSATLDVSGNLAVSGNTTLTGNVTANGNVGIGTTNPGKKLTVAGSMEVGTGSGDYQHLRIGGGNSSGFMYGCFAKYGDGVHMGYNFYNDNTNNNIINIGGGTSRLSLGYGSIGLYTGTTNTEPTNLGVFVNSSGNVGIGESNPQAKLHVGGSIKYNNYAFRFGLKDLIVLTNGSPIPFSYAEPSLPVTTITSSGYQAPVSGIYQFNVVLNIDNALSPATSYRAGLFVSSNLSVTNVNSADYAISTYISNWRLFLVQETVSSQLMNKEGSVTTYCNQGDYVRIFFSAGNVTGGNPRNYSWPTYATTFSGYLVSI